MKYAIHKPLDKKLVHKVLTILSNQALTVEELQKRLSLPKRELRMELCAIADKTDRHHYIYKIKDTGKLTLTEKGKAYLQSKTVI